MIRKSATGVIVALAVIWGGGTWYTGTQIQPGVEKFIKDFNDAKKAYEPFVKTADIIKFSDDELKLYTGIDDISKAIQSIYNEGQLIVLTLGKKGSAYFYNGESGVVPTVKVKPIDTTGAGDAFFGTFLANIEGKHFTKENIESALYKANKAGADTTQFLGALRF